jgi:hypothetical protein
MIAMSTVVTVKIHSDIRDRSGPEWASQKANHRSNGWRPELCRKYTDSNSTLARGMNSRERAHRVCFFSKNLRSSPHSVLRSVKLFRVGVDFCRSWFCDVLVANEERIVVKLFQTTAGSNGCRRLGGFRETGLGENPAISVDRGRQMVGIVGPNGRGAAPPRLYRASGVFRGASADSSTRCRPHLPLWRSESDVHGSTRSAGMPAGLAHTLR